MIPRDPVPGADQRLMPDPARLPARCCNNEAGLAADLGDVRAVLGELGIAENDLTTKQYTDAVRRARA
jgi:hypothetical protein